MAKSLVPRASKVNDVLTCPVYQSEFDDPVIINCHHSFCRSCLDQLIQCDSTRSRTFKCPVCKHKNHVPFNVVSGFQKSFVVEQLKDVILSTEPPTLSTVAGSHQVYPMCRSHPTEDMRFFCIKCQSTICRDCKISNHDGHTTQMVQERAKELKSNLKELVENIDCDLKNFTDIQDKHRNNNVYLYTLKEKGLNGIRNQAKDINNKLIL